MAPTPDSMRPREAAPAPLADPTTANLNDVLSNLPARAIALPRQQSQTTQIPTIPSFYGSLDSGPSAGTVVGITLGAVGGFAVVLWLIYTCINLGNPSNHDTSTVITEGTASVYTRRSSRRGGHRRRGHVKETVEIRRGGGVHTRGPVIVEEVVSSVGVPSDHIVVEERTSRRSVSRHRPSMPPPRRVAVSSESGSEDDDDDDEVVVIEEHTPPRRPRGSSGYREVNPGRYAGGESSFVEMRRSSSRRR